MILTPPVSTTSPGLASSQLPPRSTARSTITEPGRIEATISLEISRGAGRPGIKAVVITTALIPGRPAPRLISKEMVASMRPGSIIVDLAVERGGNCELAKPGEVVTVNDVKIVGHLNVPGRIAASASSLYARNLFAFLEILVDKQDKAIAVKWDDEIVKSTALTRDGAVIHPSFTSKSAA